jgi:hypothetical protein
MKFSKKFLKKDLISPKTGRYLFMKAVREGCYKNYTFCIARPPLFPSVSTGLREPVERTTKGAKGAFRPA